MMAIAKHKDTMVIGTKDLTLVLMQPLNAWVKLRINGTAHVNRKVMNND